MGVLESGGVGCECRRSPGPGTRTNPGATEVGRTDAGGETGSLREVARGAESEVV